MTDTPQRDQVFISYSHKDRKILGQCFNQRRDSTFSLMVTIKLTCRHCDSTNVVRNGLTNNGKQRYLCSDCGRTSRNDPQPNGYTAQERETILRAYHERSSLRGLTRTFGGSVAKNILAAISCAIKKVIGTIYCVVGNFLQHYRPDETRDKAQS